MPFPPLCDLSIMKNNNGYFEDETDKSSIPAEWKVFLGTLNKKRKDVVSRLTNWYTILKFNESIFIAIVIVTGGFRIIRYYLVIMQRNKLICEAHVSSDSGIIDVRHSMIGSEILCCFHLFCVPMGTDDILYELATGISYHSLYK